MDHPNATEGFTRMMGATMPRGLADVNLTPLTMPAQERLTLQREANDVFEQIQRAHALIDMMTGAPSEQTNGSAVQMSLSSAIAAARSEVVRLAERLDGLVGVVGQI